MVSELWAQTQSLVDKIPLTDPAVAAAVAKADWIGFLMFLVQTVGTTVVAIGIPYIALRQAQLARSQDNVMRNMATLDSTLVTLEKNTNSIKDQLVETTNKMAHAEGVLEGKKIQKKEGENK